MSEDDTGDGYTTKFVPYHQQLKQLKKNFLKPGAAKPASSGSTAAAAGAKRPLSGAVTPDAKRAKPDPTTPSNATTTTTTTTPSASPPPLPRVSGAAAAPVQMAIQKKQFVKQSAREKLKVKKMGQTAWRNDSASGYWKSDEEMRMRQQYD